MQHADSCTSAVRLINQSIAATSPLRGQTAVAPITGQLASDQANHSFFGLRLGDLPLDDIIGQRLQWAAGSPFDADQVVTPYTPLMRAVVALQRERLAVRR